MRNSESKPAPQYFDFNSTGNIAEGVHAYSDPKLKRLLSFDGQVYFECIPCGRYFWCNPVYHSKLPDPRKVDAKCDRCGKADLSPNRFCHFMEVLCSNCRESCQFEVREAHPCPQCESAHFQILTLNEFPTFPKSFGTLFEHRTKDWGISVVDDLKFLASYVRSFRQGSGFHATCIHLISLFRNLSIRGQYAKDQNRSEILNFGAVLLKQVYRETGDLRVALQSLPEINRTHYIIHPAAKCDLLTRLL